jgi:hypothetical protein
MIVIFTYPDDYNTNRIIEWFNVWGVEYRRVHLAEELFTNITISLTSDSSDILLQLSDGFILDFKKISFFLYRGGKFEFESIETKSDKLPDNFTRIHLELEFRTITEYFYSVIREKSIGWVGNLLLNKLNQLESAKSVGLNIPQSVIVNSKSEFIKWNKGCQFVTKAIQENVIFQSEEYIFIQRVNEIGESDIPNFFFSSFFQKKIVKSKEIRTFYLNGEFYSISITNNCADSPIDTRENKSTNINRPFELPIEIRIKLARLMSLFNLISGSIDLVIDNEGEYYFLEINPEGQYDWVSIFGFYNLHYKMANFLKQKELEFHEK